MQFAEFRENLGFAFTVDFINYLWYTYKEANLNSHYFVLYKQVKSDTG